MDPNTTLNMMIDAFETDQFHLARGNADDLLGWLDKGGFIPDVDRAVFRTLIRHLRNSAFERSVTTP